ncbi:MAG: Oxidoreductase [Piccolia ochrophora]|nr:MAG: Oxidoreductase [Piccolia ochrophora]
MFKSSLRSSTRRICFADFGHPQKSIRRTLSTVPPAHRSRSWKSSALRWGAVIGGLYYYNTANVFAEEPLRSTIEPSQHLEDESSTPTLEQIAADRRQRSERVQAEQSQSRQADSSSTIYDRQEAPAPRTPEEYEEEADAQGAFNPETGEINWDCPCLGGMAHGPCGEEFKAAFSCFVHSTEEPKGMDCIERFKGMQDCFRLHPEVYAEELDADDDAIEQEQAHAKAMENGMPLADPAEAATQDPKPPRPPGRSDGEGEKVAHVNRQASPSSSEVEPKIRRAKEATEQTKRVEPQSESDELTPKASHDARQENNGM